jgi:uncharacterized membrane-anchored protein
MYANAIRTLSLFCLVSVAGSLGAPRSAFAADSPTETLNWQPGPARIALGHELTLELPADHVFLAARDAKKMLAKSGNFMGDAFLGMVISKTDRELPPWWVAIEYADEGYVKDDEKIDGDAILKSIKEGSEAANAERHEKGFPPLFIDGWSEAPHYDKVDHHLIWALGAHSTRGKSVNFETRMLGRRGHVSLNLITGPDVLAADKPEVEKLLSATTFDAGARYADFDAKKGDKVATYGLAALIAGGAGVTALKVAKIGILAKFGKVLLGIIIAAKKGIILLLLAIGAFLKKVFGGKTEEPPPPPAAT